MEMESSLIKYGTETDTVAKISTELNGVLSVAGFLFPCFINTLYYSSYIKKFKIQNYIVCFIAPVFNSTF